MTIVNNYDVVYGLKIDDEFVSFAILSEFDRKIIELKTIFTLEKFRKRGYAKNLLKSLYGNYKQKYSKMLVGSDPKDILFYIKQGFDKYEKQNNGIIYYSKNLRNKEISI